MPYSNKRTFDANFLNSLDDEQATTSKQGTNPSITVVVVVQSSIQIWIETIDSWLHWKWNLSRSRGSRWGKLLGCWSFQVFCQSNYLLFGRIGKRIWVVLLWEVELLLISLYHTTTVTCLKLEMVWILVQSSLTLTTTTGGNLAVDIVVQIGVWL